MQFGLFANCQETLDAAHKLRREAEGAKNKSRFLIYQNLKLAAPVYGWHGELDRSASQKPKPRWRCRPMTRRCE
jgi:hypothetical protein